MENNLIVLDISEEKKKVLVIARNILTRKLFYLRINNIEEEYILCYNKSNIEKLVNFLKTNSVRYEIITKNLQLTKQEEVIKVFLTDIKILNNNQLITSYYKHFNNKLEQFIITTKCKIPSYLITTKTLNKVEEINNIYEFLNIFKIQKYENEFDYITYIINYEIANSNELLILSITKNVNNDQQQIFLKTNSKYFNEPHSSSNNIMIQNLLHILTTYDYDILVINYFDNVFLPLLLHNTNQNNILKISKIIQPNLRGKWLLGILLIDFKKVSKNYFNENGIEFNNLLANKLKVNFRYLNMVQKTHMFENNQLNELIEYFNLKSKYENQLFVDLKVLNFIINLSILSNLPLEFIVKGSKIMLCTWLLKTELINSKYILKISEETKIPIEGGYHIEPKVGLYNTPTIFFDFNSLYPSIIIEEKLFFTEDFIEDNPLVKVFKNLLILRKEMKQINNNTMADAIKLVTNSIYGILGNIKGYFYYPKLVNKITLFGRSLLKSLELYFNDLSITLKVNGSNLEFKLSCIYGNTDSIIINVTNYDENDQNMKLLLIDKLYLIVKNFLKYKHITIKLERTVVNLLILSKNNYFYKENNNIITKGKYNTYDIPKILKIYINTFLLRLFDSSTYKDSLELLKKRTLEFSNWFIYDKSNFDLFAINKKLEKNISEKNLQGFKNELSKKNGTSITYFDFLYLIHIEKQKFYEIKSFDEKYEIDINYYIKKYIIPFHKKVQGTLCLDIISDNKILKNKEEFSNKNIINFKCIICRQYISIFENICNCNSDILYNDFYIGNIFKNRLSNYLKTLIINPELKDEFITDLKNLRRKILEEKKEKLKIIFNDYLKEISKIFGIISLKSLFCYYYL